MAKRLLTVSELAEARLVFADGLDYKRTYVNEGAYFPPNFIADIGALFQGRKRTWDNAITLGDTSYFPRRLRTEPAEIAQDLTDISWLMHELTHQWQFQTAGWRYLSEALNVQFSLGLAAYNYTGKHSSPREALRAAVAARRRYQDFNREQQGDIVRDYYVALKRGEEAGPWEPCVDELRKHGRQVMAGRR